jgi:hypothetical protein
MTNARARRFRQGFAIAGALPLLIIFGVSAFSEIPRYWDPCFMWGQRSGMAISIRSGDPCQSVGGTSETRVGALGRLVLVQGTGVVAALLGLVGAVLARPRVSLLGAGLLFILSIPLMLSGLGIIVLLFTVLLFISCRFRCVARTEVL